MKRYLLVALFVAVAGEARADVFEPKMEQICRPVPTPSVQGKIKPKILFERLMMIPSINVAPVELDRDGNTVSYEQRVRAVLAGSRHCESPGAKCLDDPKSREATNKKLGQARVLLLDYFQRHSDPIRANESGYQFTFERNRENLEDFFLKENSPLVPVCVVRKAPEDKPDPPVAEDKSRASGRLLIRNKPSDLRVGQGDNAFKGLQRASLSINNDRVKSTTTYNIQGVVGYGFGQTPVPSWPGAYAEIIPYVSYTRQFADGRRPSNASNVDNLGIGLIGDLLFPGVGLQNAFPLTQGIYNNIAFSSQLVHSDRSDTDVLTGKITYTPYINPLVIPGIATTRRVGDFLVMLTPQAVFIYGDVINSGSSLALSKNGTFQRVGTHVEFSANADTGALEGIGVNVSYDYLKSYGGSISSITLFTAVLSYTMPKQEFWSVQLKYADGRNLDTLEQQRLLTLGVGLKY